VLLRTRLFASRWRGQVLAHSRHIPLGTVMASALLFFSAKKVQKVSVDLVVLDREKLEPIFTSDVSLLAPAKK
jgi:hypothetical protein